MRRSIRSVVGSVSFTALTAVTVLAVGAGSAVAAPAYTPATNVVQGELNAFANPAGSPPGVNVAGCRLDTAHPRPVVLINGTTQVMHSSFGYLGPLLGNAGYCVYGYNYGGDPNSAIQATGPVRAAVSSLDAFVTRVKSTTGARKVELVGYSQGGLVAELYTKFGGAGNVNSVTALSPTTHGTTLLGLATLGQMLGVIPLVGQGCPACADQVTGSDVVTALNTGPIAQAGVKYTVIETKFEDVVTPAGSSFIKEPGVINQYVQDYSSQFNLVEHVGLPYDVTAGTLTKLALVRAASR